MEHHHHSGHTMAQGHGGMMDAADMGGDRCSMNMLFTWNTHNLCIVFRQWHVRSTAGLILSLLAVVAIGAGYEALRESIRRHEHYVNKKNQDVPRQNKTKVTREAHFIKAVLYGIQNFYAFMIMLIFMTYNGWVMLAVSFGAFLGYLLFGGTTPATKETACH